MLPAGSPGPSHLPTHTQPPRQEPAVTSRDAESRPVKRQGNCSLNTFPATWGEQSGARSPSCTLCFQTILGGQPQCRGRAHCLRCLHTAEIAKALKPRFSPWQGAPTLSSESSREAGGGFTAFLHVAPLSQSAGSYYYRCMRYIRGRDLWDDSKISSGIVSLCSEKKK